MRIRGGHAVSLYVQSCYDADYQQQTNLPLEFLRVVVRNIARSWQSLAFHFGGFYSDAVHNDDFHTHKPKVIAFPLPTHPP